MTRIEGAKSVNRAPKVRVCVDLEYADYRRIKRHARGKPLAKWVRRILLLACQSLEKEKP